jgi:uncharacterized RDD family membrane protein YckC
VVYPGFWSRFAAAFLDGIILLIISIVAGFALGLILGAAGMGAQQVGSIGNLLGILIGWLYYAYQESSPKQATIGKQAFGMKVTDLNGNPISFARATGRHFAKWLSSIILLIGYIMAAFTEKKQALHDMIAGTLVVKG